MNTKIAQLAGCLISTVYDCLICFGEIAAWLVSALPGKSRLRRTLIGRWRSAFKRHDQSKCDIWFHAASRGEVATAAIIAREVLRINPGMRLFLTAVSADGVHSGGELNALFFETRYLPPDISFFMKRFVSSLKPKKLVVIDGDFWRNSIRASLGCNARVFVANGRISKRTAWIYSHIPGFGVPLFGGIEKIYAQTADDVDRFVALAGGNVVLGRNVKVGGALREARKAEVECLRKLLSEAGEIKVACFASIHPDEIEMIRTVVSCVDARSPGVCFLVVPRHPHKFFSSDILAKLGEVALVDRWPIASIECPVVLVRAMGVLPEIYSASDITIVGGTFCDIGGHNICEPMQYGSAVVYGPKIHAQEALHSAVQRDDAAFQAQSAAEAAEAAIALLLDGELREHRHENSNRMISAGRGVVCKIATELVSDIS